MTKNLPLKVWPCPVGEQAGHGTIRVEPADGAINFVAEEQSPLWVERQVIGASHSS